MSAWRRNINEKKAARSVAAAAWRIAAAWQQSGVGEEKNEIIEARKRKRNGINGVSETWRKMAKSVEKRQRQRNERQSGGENIGKMAASANGEASAANQSVARAAARAARHLRLALPLNAVCRWRHAATQRGVASAGGSARRKRCAK